MTLDFGGNYSLFSSLILIALDPYKKSWALYVILVANVSAIILDLWSVLIGEYIILFAMIDLPVEMISTIGILLVFRTKNKILRILHTDNGWFQD